MPGDEFIVRLSGIGGTGVMTVSQILGTAAMLEGNVVRGLDQTGLSQKAGPVVSDVRVSANAVPTSNRANSAGVDCLLAFDLLTAAADGHRNGARANRTVVVGSAAPTPTGTMVAHPTTPYPELDTLTARLAEVSRHELNVYPNTAALSAGLFGDATAANVLLLGVAVQVGAVPVSPAAIERAIELNGVAVERNRAAFRWGRRWAEHPHEVEQAAGLTTPVPETLDGLIARLEADLVDYQSAAYARRFRERVERARAAERAVDPASTLFTEAVARNLHKLMAYKDEYEVARLLLLPESRQAYEAVGGRRTKVTWRLHPPTLRALGRKDKMQFGPAVDADVPGAAPGQAGARHARRPVPLGRGAPRRAGDDPRVRGRPRHGHRPARRRQPARRRGAGVTSRPGPRLREHQAPPRRGLPVPARRVPPRLPLTAHRPRGEDFHKQNRAFTHDFAYLNQR